jgi:hypothetical protein
MRDSRVADGFITAIDRRGVVLATHSRTGRRDMGVCCKNASRLQGLDRGFDAVKGLAGVYLGVKSSSATRFISPHAALPSDLDTNEWLLLIVRNT